MYAIEWDSMPKRGDIKFWETREFKKLEARWRVKLEKKGFYDLEKPSGDLKVKNTRTKNFHIQEELQTQSSALGFYIHHPSIKLKPHEKRILELHSRGIYRKKIIEITRKSYQTVWKTIKKHTPIALGLYQKDSEEERAETEPNDILQFIVEITKPEKE